MARTYQKKPRTPKEKPSRQYLDDHRYVYMAIHKTKRGPKPVIVYRDTVKKVTKKFQFDPEIHIDSYIAFAENPEGRFSSFKAKLKKQSPIASWEKYKRKYPVSESFTKWIKAGFVAHTVPDVLDVGPMEIKNIYREMFRPLVLNEKLLDVLAENGHKLAPHMHAMYEIIGATEEGPEAHIAHVDDNRPDSVENYVRRIQNQFVKGTEVTSTILRSILNQMGLSSDNMMFTATGKVKKVEMRIVFNMR